MVDVTLARLAQPPQSLRQRGIPLEPLAEGLEDERLDDVVDDAALHCGAQRLHVLGRRDGDHVDRRVRVLAAAGSPPGRYVRQVDVEQQQVGPQAMRRRSGLRPRVPLADRLEARHALDIRPVNRGGHEVVVDDERPDHDGAPVRDGS